MIRHYAIIDGAALPELLPTVLRCDARIHCLLQGEHSRLARQRAPWLVPIAHGGDAMTEWMLLRLKEDAVGIGLQTHLGQHLLLTHLRRLLTVHTPHGKSLLFRYFDPEVFMMMIPSFDLQQLQEMFSPVRCWYVPEFDKRSYRRFRLCGEGLVTEQLFWDSPPGRSGFLTETTR